MAYLEGKKGMKTAIKAFGERKTEDSRNSEIYHGKNGPTIGSFLRIISLNNGEKYNPQGMKSLCTSFTYTDSIANSLEKFGEQNTEILVLVGDGGFSDECFPNIVKNAIRSGHLGRLRSIVLFLPCCSEDTRHALGARVIDIVEEITCRMVHVFVVPLGTGGSGEFDDDRKIRDALEQASRTIEIPPGLVLWGDSKSGVLIDRDASPQEAASALRKTPARILSLIEFMLDFLDSSKGAARALQSGEYARLYATLVILKDAEVTTQKAKQPVTVQKLFLDKLSGKNLGGLRTLARKARASGRKQELMDKLVGILSDKRVRIYSENNYEAQIKEALPDASGNGLRVLLACIFDRNSPVVIHETKNGMPLLDVEEIKGVDLTPMFASPQEAARHCLSSILASIGTGRKERFSGGLLFLLLLHLTGSPELRVPDPLKKLAMFALNDEAYLKCVLGGGAEAKIEHLPPWVFVPKNCNAIFQHALTVRDDASTKLIFGTALKVHRVHVAGKALKEILTNDRFWNFSFWEPSYSSLKPEETFAYLLSAENASGSWEDPQDGLPNVLLTKAVIESAKKPYFGMTKGKYRLYYADDGAEVHVDRSRLYPLGVADGKMISQIGELFCQWQKEDGKTKAGGDDAKKNRASRENKICDLFKGAKTEACSRKLSLNEREQFMVQLYPFLEHVLRISWKRNSLEGVIDRIEWKGHQIPRKGPEALPTSRKGWEAPCSRLKERIIVEFQRLVTRKEDTAAFALDCIVCTKPTRRHTEFVPIEHKGSECPHVYCKDCHMQLIKSLREEDLSEKVPLNLLTCPACRKGCVLTKANAEEDARFHPLRRYVLEKTEIHAFDAKILHRKCKGCEEIFAAGNTSCGGQEVKLPELCDACRKPTSISCPNCNLKLQHGSGCNLMRCCGIGFHCPAEYGEPCSHCFCGVAECENKEHIRGCGHVFDITAEEAKIGNG